MIKNEENDKQRILVTGANSYIGDSFKRWVETKYKNEAIVETLDMIGDNWKQHDFSQYDTVFHVAGIAHQREDKSNKELYYQVNRDLAISTAKLAKENGVKRFIFLSTMSVYGLIEGKININTPTKPVNNYGISKLQAEEQLLPLETNNFRISILRPPMVYGKNCKGNYIALSKIAKKLPVFPLVNNSRSMIYIDNLSEFVYLLIKSEQSGIFWPQNKEYMNTSEMVSMIAKSKNKKIRIIKALNWLIPFARRIPGKPSKMVAKAFGSLIYDFSMPANQIGEYQIFSNIESINLTESTLEE